MKKDKPESVNRRQKKWIKLHRDTLISAAGGRCVCCGATEGLQFAHKPRRDWVPSACSPYMRLLLYAVDYAQGRVRLLCASCHSAETKQEQAQMELPLFSYGVQSQYPF